MDKNQLYWQKFTCKGWNYSTESQTFRLYHIDSHLRVQKIISFNSKFCSKNHFLDGKNYLSEKPFTWLETNSTWVE